MLMNIVLRIIFIILEEKRVKYLIVKSYCDILDE